MRFELLDKIVELTSGERIVAVKAVSRSEEYLADHFPTFPVLPGVLMLQALTEAATWLVQEAQDFRSSLILLRSAKNVTYRSFVKPGKLLRLDVTCRAMADGSSEFDGVGTCEDREVVKARFSLSHQSLGDGGGSLGDLDRRLLHSLRERYHCLCQ